MLGVSDFLSADGVASAPVSAVFSDQCKLTSDPWNLRGVAASICTCMFRDDIVDDGIKLANMWVEVVAVQLLREES